MYQLLDLVTVRSVFYSSLIGIDNLIQSCFYLLVFLNHSVTWPTMFVKVFMPRVVHVRNNFWTYYYLNQLPSNDSSFTYQPVKIYVSSLKLTSYSILILKIYSYSVRNVHVFNSIVT
jgi:hypothetical protein